ncbi:hypothetical protein [Mesorhizobium sp.]|uniref:hypothetical protein n=1 Tax=Mesorhizobium sp. TaxID=1871066 RepID=UPI0012187D0E|nr:hypothetical protein [Mesorhizobium sp.]TIQ46739.1 MAG: hypothetical protein E5X47_23380 [Mesorhizobium sp.]TIQ56512.1 MAG: hypothetical protein E5X46_18745 [Mesorhizobium sp.]
MDWKAYRKDIEGRMAEIQEQIDVYEAGDFFTAERRGAETEWRDTTQANLAHYKRQLAQYAKIIADLDERGV